MAYYRVRRTGEQIQNGTELYHHGILGQKWGVRRFQNKDGTLTRAGRKRAMKTYDYKSSDKYKNASNREKAHRTNVYNNNKKLFGEKAANRIEYKVDKEGKNRSALAKKEFGKQVAMGVLAGATMYVAATYATQAYSIGKNAVEVNNIAVAAYTQMNGLNVENHRGIVSGLSGVKRGIDFARRYADSKASKGSSGNNRLLLTAAKTTKRYR